jgi:hypothetical protein
MLDGVYAISNTKIAIIVSFHVAPGSANSWRRATKRGGAMTDLSLQKTAKTARRADSRRPGDASK